MNFIKKVIKKLRRGAWFPFYNSFYEKLSVDEKLILLESRGGRALEGNILGILKELEEIPYEKFHRVLVVHKDTKSSIAKKVHFYGIKHIKYVCIGSISYYYYLAKAKYLVNDTSFPGRFIKKDRQVYLNTWHGTPLKKMGRDNVEEVYSMGNVMRNLLMSDYLLFPNQYMEEKMSSAYMLDNLYQGVVLREGYPRNSVFFDNQRRKEVKETLGYKDKIIIVYMPTFRGQVDAIRAEQQNREIERQLHYFEEHLREEQIVLVKLHPLVQKSVNIQEQKHIRTFPEQYETYDVLNVADVLVTDYSSVFYDFANTGKKIILFTYDEEEYRSERGIYENLEEYPFEIAKSCKEVVECICKKEVNNYRVFQKRYCTYDKPEAAERICRQVFKKEKVCSTYQYQGNGKENILIYAGDLAKNGITTALCSMLERIDTDRFNYYISFRKSSLEEAPERLKVLPEFFKVIPLASEMNMDICTMMAQMCYMKYGKKSKWIQKRLALAYHREWKKHFGSIPFRHIIHYNGYESYIIALFQYYTGTRTIWVHNDMEQEIEQKHNQNRYQLEEAYREYNNVVIVSEDIRESTQKISGRKDNITVINNCHDYKNVLCKAEQELLFDSDTLSNVSLERMKEILDSPAEKFINIGRFSVEKGHERLIKAFNRYWKCHQDTYLIIIGGTGNLYEETLRTAQRVEAADNIILIKSLSNPMPILKKCNLFILSSLYEGLGLVLLEADTLGVPVVSCNVNGPRGFMQKHGGTLVESSEDGILHGMELYEDGRINVMRVDYETLNKESIAELEKIL